jgi:hypothetical protein
MRVVSESLLRLPLAALRSILTTERMRSPTFLRRAGPSHAPSETQVPAGLQHGRLIRLPSGSSLPSYLVDRAPGQN